MKQLKHWMAVAGVAAAAGSLAVATPAAAYASTVHAAAGPDVVAPSAPTGLSVSNVGDGTLKLSWNAPANNGGASIEGYNLYVSNGEGAGNESNIPYNGILLVSGTSYTFGSPTDEALDNDGSTSAFEVTAVNAAGIESPLSSEITAVPQAQAPQAPTGVSATGGYDSATVSWNQSFQPSGVTPADYYEVNVIDNTTGTTSSDVNGTTSGLNYPVTGLTDGDSYTFTVQGCDWDMGCSSPSTASNTVVPAPTAPGTVSDLTAEYGNGDAILWFTVPQQNDDLGTMFGLNIFEGSSAGSESATPINGNFPITKCTYGTFATGDRCGIDVSDILGTPLTNGTQYYWTVEAINQIAPAAAASNEATATPTSVQPGAATLSATAGAGTASLSWTAPSNTGGWPIKGYKIFRIGASVMDSKTWTVGPGITTASDSGLVYGHTYKYMVQALTAENASDVGADIGVNELTTGLDSNAVTISPIDTPAAVSDLAVSTHSTSTDGLIDISWTVPSYIGNAGTMSWSYILDGVKTTLSPSSITCSLSGNPSTASTPGATCDATSIPATNNQAHTITITGQNTDGNTSDVSNAVSFQGGQFTIGAPQDLVAMPTDGAVSLSWDAPSYLGESGNAVSSYTVLEDSGSGFAPYTGCTAITTTSCELGADNGTSYQFEVTAKDSNGNTSVPSSSVSATPIENEDVPNAPGGYGYFGSSATGGTLSWTASTLPASTDPAVLGYDVLRHDANGAYHVVNTSLITGTSLSLTDLTPGEQFVVIAYNANGWSGQSETFTFGTAPSEGPGRPSEPQDLQVVSNGTLAQDTWQAPADDGGAPIAGYNLLAAGQMSCYSVEDPYGQPFTVPFSGIRLNDGLITGTSAVGDLTTVSTLLSDFSEYPYFDCSLLNYEVNVMAVNTAGYSSWCTPLVAPVTGQVGAFVPDAPESTSANRAGGGSIFVAWHAPSSDGGAPVTQYLVTPYDNGVAGTPVTVSGNSTTFNGLNPGDNYFFTVAAINSVGAGPSDQSNVVSVGKYSSVTKIHVSKSRITFGKESAEKFAVTVSGPAGGPTPTGTVSIGGVCKITLAGGSGSCTLSNKQLKAGKYSFHAVYSGDSNFGNSSSGYVSVKVTK